MCRLDRRRNPRSPSAQRHAHDEQRHQRCHHLATGYSQEIAPAVTGAGSSDCKGISEARFNQTANYFGKTHSLVSAVAQLLAERRSSFASMHAWCCCE
jgi:hypothetical protein